MTIITMRKKNNETVLDIPFSLTRADELIDDYLCSICEISELRLPKNESIWMSLSITKFVAKDSKL